MAAISDSLIRWRIGTVPYLVAKPLTLNLEKDPRISLIEAPPATLGAMLHAGELDIALASSALALGDSPLQMWLDGPVIASNGPVHSVLLFLAPGISAPSEVRSWFADPHSRTGRLLTHWLSQNAWNNLKALCVETPADVDPFAAALEADIDAVQLIGDPALVARSAHPDWLCIDLGLEWKTATATPFVFAGWMFRPGFEIAPLANLLRNTAVTGLRSRPTLALQAAHGDSDHAAFLRRYLCDDLHYHLTPTEIQACLKLLNLCVSQAPSAVFGACSPPDSTN